MAPGAQSLWAGNAAQDIVKPVIKSQKRLGTKIVGGVYRTMLEGLAAVNSASLFLLVYDQSILSVTSLLVIPRHFLIRGIIEKRKSLPPSARRDGWTKCNILPRDIPNAGRIFLVRNGVAEPQETVLAQWRRTLFVREQRDPDARGWSPAVMRCVEELNRSNFRLADVYAFEERLQAAYPGNRHIREKVRQQLQVLRDKGYLEFTGKGAYRLAGRPA